MSIFVIDGTETVGRHEIRGLLATRCFSPMRELGAPKAGIWHVSPWIGRVDDIRANSMQLNRQIVAIDTHEDLKTMVLGASVRHAQHGVESALAGGHSSTMPVSIFRQQTQQPLTDLGMNRFQAGRNTQR